MAQFRAKARAVDLLGKGQIADLPTAISELWKNGFDAYGDELEAFLYMKDYMEYPDSVFVISDDGKGMSREDILDKWFVLGTDSKTRGEPDKKGPETLNKEPRVKMGEKGIGRLAVAYLGPQMLMLTKKLNYPLEVVFFDWRILENYDLFLSDVNIPLKTIKSVSSFKETYEQLKKEFLGNFPAVIEGEKDPWKDQQTLKKAIIEDCKALVVPDYIVESAISSLLDNPTKTHATKFVIFKPDLQIIELKNFTKKTEDEDNRDDTSVKHTVASLVGLFNLFKTENPEHKTYFWIYEDSEKDKYDLLTFKSFFTPNDFEECDHLIDGYFDEEGKFDGDVRIYRKTVSHSFKPIRKKGKTNYGPFKIKLGYVQDRDFETLLNEERKKVFEEKLSYYSGVFIYRDGFRVLPYGRPDTDFLEFEERRSTGAGTYFFSKRRMFGYIEISREKNVNLKDKSSREGFINNAAFRDFRTDLIAFFKDLAKKYFATKATYDYKRDQQGELKKLADAEKQEKERDIQARKEFAQKLKTLPQQLKTLQNEYDNLVTELEKKSNESEIVYEEIQTLLSKIESYKVRIADLKLTKPVRFKPTELQRKNYHAYNKEYHEVLEHVEVSDSLILTVRERLKVHELFNEFESRSQLYRNTLSDDFIEFGSRLENIFKKIRDEFNNEKIGFTNDFTDKYKSIIPDKKDAKEITRSMKLLENIFTESRERMSERVSPYLEHLERLSFEVNEDNLVGFYKTKFEEMKEEWNKTYELAQLGIAVEIIDHQFNTLYSQLAESIRSLKSYLQSGKDSEKRFRNLDTTFAHLQDNYKLLQPLYRTTGRVRKEITGSELKEYSQDFFGSRLKDNKIKFTITPKAAKWTVNSYESIFKPVLINVINNAIYWLQPVDNREIRIDVKDNKLLIMNSGVPIEDYLLEDVFKLFFSNRPSGRGIGLYLAKQSLNGIGFEIEATNKPAYNQLDGACFCIYKQEI
jgi:signal transduction histidine kinase